jgi:hypothetical protein
MKSKHKNHKSNNWFLEKVLKMMDLIPGVVAQACNPRHLRGGRERKMELQGQFGQM